MDEALECPRMDIPPSLNENPTDHNLQSLVKDHGVVQRQELASMIFVDPF